MPPALRQRLTSSGASEERRRLKDEAERTARGLAEHARQTDALTNRFGIVGYGKRDLQELAQHAATLIEHKDHLPELLALRRERSDLDAIGFGDFLVRADECRIEPRLLTKIRADFVASRRADRARQTTPEIAKSAGSALEARRKQFAERDRAKIENDRITVKAKLLKRVPFPGSSLGKKRDWTEMALVKSELDKQKRFVPVRSLLARAGRSIRALKPCFMMSPLSLAKFMTPGSLDFDLLVIDEASQMRPEDALGAILRSRQIVVVGGRVGM
jgi:hypothetical protein